jgi:hypothetical protein
VLSGRTFQVCRGLQVVCVHVKGPKKNIWSALWVAFKYCWECWGFLVSQVERRLAWPCWGFVGGELDKQRVPPSGQYLGKYPRYWPSYY